MRYYKVIKFYEVLKTCKVMDFYKLIKIHKVVKFYKDIKINKAINIYKISLQSWVLVVEYIDVTAQNRF